MRITPSAGRQSPARRLPNGQPCRPEAIAFRDEICGCLHHAITLLGEGFAPFFLSAATFELAATALLPATATAFTGADFFAPGASTVDFLTVGAFAPAVLPAVTVFCARPCSGLRHLFFLFCLLLLL